ncbi:large conductance mechanosensitive channel protein MscL [Nocardia transvalensis]|uniref:large conductance mechanosensitive channel protein MscL n=1 Tax=Nocardia transvalensis TaxID=37333 RepID=UPI001894929C|nr:large conductance mechanosensitive channel protein MscL [Nocardia transvalensis]MBF6330590.1 large conductance mechanosensitive channel protein MscL [Nocardia transvalensis]
MLKGFRDFLFRGNVIDLAVAVVMGTAFVAIVTALTNGIVNPLLAVFGGTGELGLGFRLVSDKPATFIAVGPIITAAINFVIIAAILYFVLVLPATRARNRWGKSIEPSLTDTQLLTEIRDLLAEGGKSAGGRHET